MRSASLLYGVLFVTSLVSTIVACSPTKFSPLVSPNSVCDTSTTTCVVQNGTTNIVQPYKVGSGKVDILFVNDNSASMSIIQKNLAARFGGFIENLDSKEIDYKIMMITTDVTSISDKNLISFTNGQLSLTKSDSNRVQLFNSSIVRQETINCENFIKSSYYTYGSNFQSNSNYVNNYKNYCPSNDERGIFAANFFISNKSSEIRDDAHLNIIVLSNEDVRSGLYSSNSNFSLTSEDKASTFRDLMSSKFPSKYWEFNSIITKDASCGYQQQQQFVDNNGQPIRDSNGNFVVGANPGVEYAALSASSSLDVDGNPSPRGQILSICDSDYSQHFRNIATKISDASRQMTLKCNPSEAPVVELSNNPNATVPYVWNGANKITFNKGSEGIPVVVKYKCNIGSVQ